MKDQNQGYCQRATVSRGVTKYNTTYQHINPGPRVLKVPHEFSNEIRLSQKGRARKQNSCLKGSKGMPKNPHIFEFSGF
ncbi:hypothetical protein McpCs1_04580 [Methanocorpusculaceae archaeon Cs1]|uniref:Uncharacterized protein n=1 Tax=Methanorbis rubei TaxID=3028300 RepID=A0AAE4SB50_9EURY|nr:hypothetical protein [Methanocorpusculaceae archaeon Cs1]